MSKVKILIVEDNKYLSDSLKFNLKSREYDVIALENAVNALDIYKLEKPDIVLTDIFMPEKDGLELIRELKEISPDVKIIAMSAGSSAFSNSRDYLGVSQQFGAAFTLQKPFSIEKLLSAVNEVLATA